MNTKGIPKELTDERRWICRNSDKQPIDPATRAPLKDWHAKRNRMTFQAALEGAKGIHAGIGFITGDGIACVDIDHCIIDGSAAPAALEIVEALNSYAEISPSGHGLHVWGWAEGIEGLALNGKGSRYQHAGIDISGLTDDPNAESHIEIYCHSGKYVTVTGKSFGEPRPLRDFTKDLQGLVRERFPEWQQEERTPAATDVYTLTDETRGLVLSALEVLTADKLNRDEWVRVGMALYHSGFSFETFDEWSAKDTERGEKGYNPAECGRVWRSFGRGSGEQVRAETILYMAGKYGWTAPHTSAAEEFSDSYTDEETSAPEPGRKKDLLPVMPVSAFDLLKTDPQQAQPLICGILRKGHKMLISGPSKAGKSFALIELANAIASGGNWMGHHCEQGRVLYLDMEIDPNSFLRRVADTSAAAGINQEASKNIDVVSLRGHVADFETMTRQVIGTVRETGAEYAAIIIDPIYKILNGDENSAGDMGLFCNRIDRICRETGAAVIYCHHYTKGYQAGKQAIDRASGSGVFARDPDAVLSLTQLHIESDLEYREELITKCAAVEFLNANVPGWVDETCPEVDSGQQLQEFAKQKAPAGFTAKMNACMRKASDRIRYVTAWRLEGSLREFPPLQPVNAWYIHPLHVVDYDGVLTGAEIENGQDEQERRREKATALAKEKQAEVWAEKKLEFRQTFERMEGETGSAVTVAGMVRALGVTRQTVYRWVDQMPDEFTREAGEIHRILQGV